MLVVADTNIVVSRCLNPSGAPAQLVRAITYGRIDLVMSSEIRVEYLEALRKPTVHALHKMSDSKLKLIVEELWRFSIQVFPVQTRHWVPADPDDDIFIEAAVTGEADAIVSGDRHLLKLASVSGIPIITAREFLEEWQPHR